MKRIIGPLASAAAVALCASAATAQLTYPDSRPATGDMTYSDARPAPSVDLMNQGGPPIVFKLPSGPAPDAPTPADGDAMSYGSAARSADRMAPADLVGPWYVEGFVGGLNGGDYFAATLKPHTTSMTGDVIAGVAAGREIVDLGYGFSIDAGLMVNARVDEGGAEIALPIGFVFDGLPWRDRLPMRLRLSIGPSFTTKISDQERAQDGGDGSKFLLLASPEISVALPSAPEWEAFFRVHHRFGVFGLFNGVDDGSNYFVAGLRHRFGVGELDPLE